MPVPPGTVIDKRYKVIRLLGEGGYGAVYLAEDMRLGNKPLALKESFNKSAAALEQFRLEAQLLAELNHPGLPRVTDHFIDPDGRQFLAMDYIEGEDLDQHLLNLGHALPEREAAAVLLQVCEAVAYLHTRSPRPVIHRDIKPPNIKITPDGRAVLVDFGIAKLYSPNQHTAKIAKAITPHFSSPEQHTANTDKRSDVYSLGATLYLLAAGEVPTDAMDRLDGDQMLTPPSHLNPVITAGLDKIILKALELNPDRRYADASLLAAELRLFIQDQPAHFSQVGQSRAAPIIAAGPSGKVCPRCGFFNRPEASFCARDGAPLGKPIPAAASKPGVSPPQPAVPSPGLSTQQLFERANSLARHQEYEKAIPDYEASLQQGLADLSLYYNLGLSYLEVSRFSNAANILEKGASRYPRDGDLHYQLARAYIGLNMHSQALDAARRACQLAPGDAANLRQYGRLLFEAKRFSEAVIPLESSLRSDSSSLPACILLGRAYGESHRLRPALNALRQAARLDPKSPEAHYWIGVYYLKANKHRQAKEALQDALRVSPNYQMAHDLLEKL